MDEIGVEHTSYRIQEVYPTHEIFVLINMLAETTSQSAFDVMEKFGEFMVPDLMLLYSKYVDPNWRTYEMLLNTEQVMHGAVRRQYLKANTSKLLVTKKGIGS